VVVPPGLELPPAPTRSEARLSLGLAPDAPVIAFVARLTKVKRPDRFVAVARLVAARRPDAVFVVVGEGEELADMQRQGSDLGERIRYLGWRSDVETVYAAADVTVLTSDNEGMPVSLIEAASVGCPAVTTDVGSAGEVVEDGVSGHVTALEPEALADATVRILSDPAARDRFGAAAAARARDRFSRDRLVDDIATLYDEIIDRSLVCALS
jgi:glycosyltransferase involved in cell wall biosynthesis